MNPFALTAEERAGAMMAPARTPDVGAFMDNLGALRAMLGPSVASRMQAHGEDQEARWDAGERGPTPLTEDRVWLADDVAGALLGPMGMAGVIKAYHGSPHRFDRFDMSKIGTGEGAQAFGHGLYFAESPGVAQNYRDVLSGVGRLQGGNTAKAGSQSANLAEEFGRNGTSWTNDVGDNIETRAADMASSVVDGPNGETIYNLEDGSQFISFGDFWDVSDGAFGQGALYTTRLDVEPEDLLDWDAPLSQQSEKVKKALGFSTLSEDQIHDEALRLMEEGNKKVGRVGGWQDDPVIKARIDELQDELDRLPPNITGADYYRGSEPDSWLHSTLAGGNSSPSMSEELRRRGVPGIRYLDQQSRYIPSNLPDNPIANEARQFLDAVSGDADAALKAFNDSNPVQRLASDERDEVRKVIKAAGRQATRNFVIFDDKLIDIEGVE